jgi:hypothetical protein
MVRENRENRRENPGELETTEGKPGELENEGKPTEGKPGELEKLNEGKTDR